jgi:hypothetical protein
MRKHLLIPDTQVRPGVDTSHIDWLARAIVEYKPDVIVHIGDHWDMRSLSSYDKPGGLALEGTRIKDDLDAGNEAFSRMVAPMEAEIQRLAGGHRKRWAPERHFCFGNHEQRLDRISANDAKFAGVLTKDVMLTPGFTRHEFLEIVDIDGVSYSHYFANQHSGRPIGGSIDSRLNKIGRTFVQGHEQGLLYGIKQFPGSMTRHGLVAGSFYLHDEEYRGVQCNGEWRGIVVLNEVNAGAFDVMPLSMDYLKRRFS